MPSTLKTKGIIFSKKPLTFNPVPLELSGNPLPWIESAKYLGNTITSVPDGLGKDAKQKRGAYIERNCELLQEFPHAHPEVKCQINRIYNSSFPGSVLYDLTSPSVSQLVNSWSMSVRYMWDLPLQSHRYLIEQLGGQHAESMLIIRYVKFIQSLAKSPKMCVQFLLQKVLKNVETVTGRNVAYITRKTGHKFDILSVTPNLLKRSLKFCNMKTEDKWRVNMIKEVTNIKQNMLKLEGFSTEELDDSMN